MTQADVIFCVRWLVEAFPAVPVLLLLMVADVITGLMCAFSTKTLCSSASFRGMCKKASTLIIVGLAYVLDQFQNIPIGHLVAISFIATESLSILENAAAIGVPMPEILVGTLLKMRDSKTPQAPPPMSIPVPPAPVPPVNVEITTRKGVTVHESSDASGTQRISITNHAKS